jgi:hypothetical protein
MKIDGECHCGKIAYQAEVDPDTLVICHCTDPDRGGVGLSRGRTRIRRIIRDASGRAKNLHKDLGARD